VLVIVKPETVVRWHRPGLASIGAWRSRQAGGRPKVREEIRILIRRMAGENAGWGAPKIYGELRKLGFEVSERTVARYLKRLRRGGDPGQPWLTFLANHRRGDRGVGFLYSAKVTFQMLYGFFVIEPGRVGFYISTRRPSHQ
jgi:hypothetical protein